MKTKMMPTRYKQLEVILQQSVEGNQTNYECIYVDHYCIIFGATPSTGKVMIPTDLVLEWISALETGQIDVSMDARTMRDKVKAHSDWANYLHGFETHLYAILNSWAKTKVSAE